ncbi:MAG: hypothetical protein RIS43_595 [Actinomycetota bacterium]
MSFNSRWIHHDGSPLYVDNLAPAPGDEVTVRVRVPRELEPEYVVVRTVHDGEPKIIRAEIERSTAVETWWHAKLPIVNKRSHYRWGFAGGNVGYGWLTAIGWLDYDCTDAHDFAISTASLAPSWASSAVVYQVFPDRFATSGRITDVPDWCEQRDWHQRPDGRSVHTPREYFGGDLWGAADKLEHLEELGATVIYFTPFFPGKSTHRYDASTFDQVDPLLGGDEALIALSEKAHAMGIRVMGDITLNHTGVEHEWFLKAMEGHPVYSTFYTFNPSYEFGYACWLGVRSLPKLNYQSEELYETLITGHNSVVRKWLQAPFNLDGWRVDVANMSGRQGEVDLTHHVAHSTRVTMEQEGDKLLIAEHFHDAGPDLDGDGWHGAMNYSAFMKPMWSWIVGESFDRDWLGMPNRVPSTTGRQMVSSIQSFAARMPWRSYNSSWSLLDSHDTARIRSVAGGRDRHHVAAAMMMTLPGTPMIFAGDEIGAEGLWGEDSRTTFPWDNKESWDMETFSVYKDLIALRKSREALIEGGLRWIHVEDDLVVYLRESKNETLLIAAARNAAKASIDVSRFGFTKSQPILGQVHTAEGALLQLDFPRASFAIWSLA